METHAKTRQLSIVTVGKWFKIVWKKRKSVRLVLCDMNVTETKQKEENKRNQKLA